ncbi:hypothetical protein KAW38_00525 [Candidatus Micrarchaeota archaeon]|nr:hypothetical protein [Candidatus Micrarchaeota archaeon]
MKIIWMVFLVSMLLFAGCIGPEDQELEVTPIIDAQDSAQPDDGLEQNGEVEEDEEEVLALDIDTAVLSGLAYECIFIEDTQTQTIKVLNGNMRILTENSATGDSSEVISTKDEILYIKGMSIEGSEEFTSENCDWIKIDNKRLSELLEEIYPDEEPSLGMAGMPKTTPSIEMDYECHPALFGSEIFNPESEGTVCDMTDSILESLEAMQEVMNEAGDQLGDTNPCEGLTGEEKEQCEAMMEQYFS